MNQVRIVVPLGTRNPEAAVAAASGAGRHALPRSWKQLWIELLASIAVMQVRYHARHAVRPQPSRLPRPSRRTVRRLGLASMLAAGGLLAVGVTAARFTATGTSSASAFSTGTVSVGLDNSGTAVQCNVSNLAPGDASSGYLPSGSSVANNSSQQCSYLVKYTGSVPAYLAVDVAITNGGTKLYDATATGLQLLVRDTAGATYVGSGSAQGGTKYTGQAGGSFGQTLASPGTAANLLVATSAKSNGFTDKFTVDYNLAIPSSNTNIGGSSTVTLTFHAVQAGNNALPGTCSAAGVSCVTGMSWS